VSFSYAAGGDCSWFHSCPKVHELQDFYWMRFNSTAWQTPSGMARPIHESGAVCFAGRRRSAERPLVLEAARDIAYLQRAATKGRLELRAEWLMCTRRIGA
jgi:hypothetical protein